MLLRASDQPASDVVTLIDAEAVDVVARSPRRGRLGLFVLLALAIVAVVVLVKKRDRSDEPAVDLDDADEVAGIVAPQPGSGPSESVASS